MKMKQVYEANPALGDPLSIQGQLAENGHRLDKLRAELKKFQGFLDEMEGRAPPGPDAPGQRASAPAGSTAPNVGGGGVGAGGRRGSVSDGAESLSRSASDSSVSGRGDKGRNGGVTAAAAAAATAAGGANG